MNGVETSAADLSGARLDGLILPVLIFIFAVTELTTPGGITGACPTYAAPVTSGRITEGQIDEVSGLSRSGLRRVLWFQEDSGNGPWLYATTPGGDLRATIDVGNASNRDWEDMARSAGRLWIGDIGDNARVRTDIRIYWLSEPATLGDRTVNARMLTLRYPDEAHDAEGMLVDGRHERLFVFEKQGEESTSRVYAADVDGIRDGDELELQLVTSVPIENITAANVGRDGVIVKGDSGGLLFPWVGRSVARTLRQSDACPVALPAGESVAFSRSGRRLYTVPEGSDPPIEYVERLT